MNNEREGKPMLADDLLSGVSEIARFIGEEERRAYHLIVTGQLPHLSGVGSTAQRSLKFENTSVSFSSGERLECAKKTPAGGHRRGASEGQFAPQAALRHPLIFIRMRTSDLEPRVDRCIRRTARQAVASGHPACWGSTRRACIPGGTASAFSAWRC